MVANTLIGTDDDLGDTVATFVFDIALARSLLLTSGLTLVGCLAVGLPVSIAHLLGGGRATAVLLPIVLVGVSLVASWGVLNAVTRLRRRRDRFVVHRLGLARHHDGAITRIRWIEVALVTHSGSNTGSRIARWAGSDYMCHIDLGDATTTGFDNYVIDAAELGREIERRSLL